MAHFAIVCPADAGHLLSIGPVGQELVRRGHRLTVIGEPHAAPLAEQLGLPLYALNTDGLADTSQFLLRLAFAPFGATVQVDLREWLHWQAKAVLQLLPGALEELAIDGLIVDQVVAAGGTVAEQAGLPFVTICPTIMWNEEMGIPPFFTSWQYASGQRARLRNRLGYAAWHWFGSPTVKLINRHRNNWGLAPLRTIDDTYSSLAQISQLCPGFDFPRRELRDTFHYVGSLTTDRRIKSDHGFPWDRLDGRPLVFASLGTTADPANPPVFRRILAACAGLDAQLVLALGQWNDEDEPVQDQLGAIPANALVVDFAPQLELLERASVLVTHAGVNTVLEALHRAVPMVALPRSADQPAMGSRVVHSGTGLLGSFWRDSTSQIQEHIRAVMAKGSFRNRAKEIQREMVAAGGSSRAADIVEEALITRRPVRRQ